jgi:hypothetical protein
MQNAFGTLVAVGIVAGGFLLTGDLGWCARQISQAFDPTPAPAAAAPAADVSPAVTDGETAPAAPADDDAGRQSAAPGPAPRRPPAAGLELVDLTKASPGQRVVVWTAARGRLPECHVIHVLDAGGNEALLQRRGAAGDGPVRRVAIATAAAAFSGLADSCVLRLHGSFHVRPLGLTPGLDGIVEARGPITGLAVE